MLIKTRLHINVAVSVAMAFLIVAVLYLALQRVDRALEQADVSGEIITGSFERSMFRSDYLRSGSEASKKRWFAKHEEVSRLLKAALEVFPHSHDRKIVEEMIRDHEEIGRIFSTLVGNREKRAPGAAPVAPETETRLAGELEKRLYIKIINARRLDQAAGMHLLAAFRQAGVTIICLLAVVLAAAILNSWTMRRTFADRIERLREGASIIGGGNLEHRIDIRGDDEFAELSRTFDAMTEKLRLSRLVLEKEIAEREKGEQLISRNEAMLKRAQEIAHLGSWELDIVNNTLTWSDEVFRIFGQRPHEFEATYEAFLEAVHPDDRAAVDAAYAGSLAEGRDTYEIEHRIVRRSTGDIRYVHEKCEHVRDETGSLVRSVGMVHDITERRNAEEALRESEKRYRSLFDNMLDGFAYSKMLFDDRGLPTDFIFLDVNRSFSRLTGMDNVVGKKATEVFPGIRESHSKLFEIYGRVALTGIPETFEIDFKPLGRWFSVGGYSIQREHFVAVFDDITERKDAEEALKKVNEELEVRVALRTKELEESRAKLKAQYEELQITFHELEAATAERLQAMEELREKDRMMIQQNRMAAMGEMLGNIAHQWRQPLNILGLMIQDLGLSHESGEFSKALLDDSIDKAMKVVLHLSQTIDDFSNFAAPDKERSLFRVDQIISKTISLVVESFRNQRIAIEFTTSGEPHINGYPHEYAQVILNILMNARDAFLERETDNPRINIRSWEETGRSVVTVTDNAGGIEPPILGKIFEPYFTTKEPGKGTGVGLFMSKTIIEKNMGGRLNVRNTGDGAELRIEV